MELNWYEHPIYILRKHVKETEKMLTSETYPLLPYEHQDLVDKLEEMVKNDDKTIADMFTFCSGSDLTELMKKDEKSYLKMDKGDFLKELLSEVPQKRLTMTMEFIKKDKSIIAYSKLDEGWHSEKFKIDEDFEVVFETNFGYGSKAYFKAILYYKNIPVYLGPVHPGVDPKYDGFYLTFGAPDMNVTLKLAPEFIEYKKAMDGIAMIYNELVDNLSYAVQAIVLAPYLSKEINSKYWDNKWNSIYEIRQKLNADK